MTGPVERVPLTDEQLRIDLAAVRRDVSRANDPAVAGGGRRVVEGRVRYAASALIDEVERLAAELRASRARERELQQRIGTVVETARGAHQAWLDADAGTWDGPVLLASWVLAALTGTETTDV